MEKTNFEKKRFKNKLLLGIEAAYISVLILSLIFNFKLFIHLAAFLLLVTVVVGVFELFENHKKIKEQKQFDNKYNS
ncbi:hypothetical protein PT285_00550 [Lactobacillus sp. ESL0791]|uniref:hypothetical protein n=1 Tax=Lactobacillus sp. ESL0791 TaxID=2983234 RepID=UPI0023F83958|nr:hypothetical protein [Lactobacillus sp. ESL0791]MDF7637929.1 hypothetical protein [Lactobacillus sp. ESL0791]